MRRILAAAVVAGLSLGALAVTADAQQRATLTMETGTQVRVETHAAPGERVVGRVLASTRDSLSVLPRRSAEVVTYHVPELLSLEVRGGRDRRRGALIGAGVAAGIAVVFGGIDAARGELGVGEVGGIAVGNALVGALAGALLAPKGWQRLPVPGAPQASHDLGRPGGS